MTKAVMPKEQNTVSLTLVKVLHEDVFSVQPFTVSEITMTVL